MKTIYFILPNLKQGGAERVISYLANYLDRSKYKPVLVLFQKEGVYLNHLSSDVEIIDLKVDRIRKSFFKIIKLIKNDRPDIVFFGWGEIAAFLSPVIPFLRKYSKFVARETNVVTEHVTKKSILFFYKFYNNFDSIIAQSDDMRNDLMVNYNILPQKVVKINNPIDTDLVFKEMNLSIELPFEKNGFNVLSMGNLTQRKGFDNLLKVFAFLKDKAINLYILGDGDDKEKLLQQKNDLRLENVHFIGAVDNPFPYLKKADLFVLSSRYEGFPNVLLEAGLCGTYALANFCPGGIDEIIEEGINGETAYVSDYEAFANKIENILNQEHSEIDIKNSIMRRFERKIIIEKYESLFNQL